MLGYTNATVVRSMGFGTLFPPQLEDEKPWVVVITNLIDAILQLLFSSSRLLIQEMKKSPF